MKKLLIFVLFISFSGLYAQLDRTRPPKAGPAPEIKISDYESFTLSNGLKVFVVENHKLPSVSFSLTLDVDPIVENQYAGYVSLSGQLLRTGTKTRSKAVLDEEIDFIGATLNTSATGIYASSLKKHTPKLLELMSDIILNAEFRQEELDKLKKQKISELAAAKDEPDEIAGRVIQTLYYGKGHPYADVETEETIGSITLDMCRDYYTSYFRPNIAYLAVVGDINKSEAETLLNKYLAAWQKAEVKKFSYTAPASPSGVKVALVDRSNAVQSTVRVGYPIDFRIGDENQIKLTVANTILGGGVFRLFANLREKHAFTYGAYSSVAPDRLAGNFTASTEVRNSVTDSAITEILYEMKRIREEKVEDKELQKAVNYNTGNFAIALEKPETIARFAINIARFNLPRDFYADYLKNLSSVSASDIQSAAQKYIHPDNTYIIVVGNAKEVADKLKKFGTLEYYDIYGRKYDPSSSAVPEGKKAQDVIDEYIRQIGGKENISALKDVVTVIGNNDARMSLEISVWQKAPGKLLQKMQTPGGTVTIVYDGKQGLQISPAGKQPLTGEALEDIKYEADLKNILNPEKYGLKISLAGVERLDNGDAYRLDYETPAGKKWTEYYDVKSGLKIRQVKSLGPQMGNMNQTVDYSDYRDVSGIKYPFKIVQSMGPQKIELTVKSMKVNSGIDDSVFKVK